MQFMPKSREEVASMELLPKGTYAFEITGATDKKSQAGNPMIELEVQITNAGVSRIIKDYLLAQWPVKLRNAAEACSLLKQYDAGELSGADFVGKTGKVNIVVEKDRYKKFPDKNAVASYVVKSAGYFSRSKA
jgi:hypothetical protein